MNSAASKILFSIFLLVLASACFLGFQHRILTQDKFFLESRIESMENLLGQKIDEAKALKAERDDLSRKYDSERKRADSIEILLGAAKDTIGVLEKVNATDSELLKKYSKVYFLNENYSPQKLAKINPEYVFNPANDYYFLEKILSYLEQMMSDAREIGIDIKIISAYRSFDEQRNIKSSYSVVYGAGANKFSADQGYSEHQLGTTVDFTEDGIGSPFAVSAFEKTAVYQWLMENAYKYGFIMSYQKNNAYYQYEPWHWRFIGRDFASRLYDDGKNFYDLDQRLIDTYLISFFD